MRRDLSILRDRRFGLLLSARTASVLGSAFGPVALTFGVLALPGATATKLSIVLAAESISIVAFMLLGGVIADRFPRFRVMVAADLVAAAAWGGISAMLITGWVPMWLLIILAAIAGMATALFWPAFTGVVPEVVPAPKLQAANGILRLGMNVARFGGFAVAGGAVVIFGAGWAMALNAVLLIGSAAFIAGLRLPVAARGREGTGGKADNILRDLHDGWREFRSRQWLWVVVAQYSFVVMVLQAVFGVLGPVIANERLGGPKGWSWILAAEAIGMLIGVIFAIRARPKRPIRLVVLLTFPLASLPLALGLGAPLYVAAAAAFLGGVAIDILSVLWDTTMQREIPEESLSRVSSYDALGSLMFGPIGLLLAGPAVDGLGATNALLISAVVTAVASAAALCSPGVRRLEWTAQADSGTSNEPSRAEPAHAEQAAGSEPGRSIARLDRNEQGQAAASLLSKTST